MATIVQVEFPPVFAEEYVNVDFSQLYSRCKYGDHTEVITMSDRGYPHTVTGEETETLKLDNDGNAFMILIGNASCASGTTLIEASLEDGAVHHVHDRLHDRTASALVPQLRNERTGWETSETVTEGPGSNRFRGPRALTGGAPGKGRARARVPATA